MHGVGYQYRPGDAGKILVSSGSARADESVLGHPRRLIEEDANILVRLQGRDFRMVGCTVEGRIPVRLDGNEASALLENVAWTFRGERRTVTFAEIFANRAKDFWSTERAVERAMDEVLQASVYVGGMERLRLSVGDYLERFKKGHVLILGDFSDQGMSRIERIRTGLGELGYYGITLKDVPEVPEYDLRQKLAAIAPVCRFVIVDDSSQAGHAAELPIIEMLRVVTVVARMRGSRSTFVTRPLDATSRVIKEVEYEEASLQETLVAAARWAESVIGDLSARYAREYPWRRPSAG